MDPSVLNDKRLVDYANTSSENLNQVETIAKIKYDVYKNNPQCGEYLAYYGEIFALKLYIRDNPNFDRQLLIERAKQSGQLETVKFLTINLPKDTKYEIAKNLSYDDLSNFIKANYLERDTRFNNLLELKKFRKLKASFYYVPADKFSDLISSGTSKDEFEYPTIDIDFDELAKKLTTYYEKNSIPIDDGDIVATSRDKIYKYRYSYSNLFYWNRDHFVSGDFDGMLDWIPDDLIITDTRFNPSYWIDVIKEKTDMEIILNLHISKDIIDSISKTLKLVRDSNTGKQFYETTYKFMDGVYRIIVSEEVLNSTRGDLYSSFWTVEKDLIRKAGILVGDDDKVIYVSI